VGRGANVGVRRRVGAGEGARTHLPPRQANPLQQEQVSPKEEHD